jgi:hypothetical protein
MPTRLVEQDDRVSARRDGLRDLGEMQGHGLARAAGQDETCALAFSRADRSEDVGKGRALKVAAFKMRADALFMPVGALALSAG